MNYGGVKYWGKMKVFVFKGDTFYEIEVNSKYSNKINVNSSPRDLETWRYEHSPWNVGNGHFEHQAS